MAAGLPYFLGDCRFIYFRFRFSTKPGCVIPVTSRESWDVTDKTLSSQISSCCGGFPVSRAEDFRKSGNSRSTAFPARNSLIIDITGFRLVTGTSD